MEETIMSVTPEQVLDFQLKLSELMEAYDWKVDDKTDIPVVLIGVHYAENNAHRISVQASTQCLHCIEEVLHGINVFTVRLLAEGLTDDHGTKH